MNCYDVTDTAQSFLNSATMIDECATPSLYKSGELHALPINGLKFAQV
ncbi:MAG: hypothetical protein ACKVU0_12695 [Saprospiraceae bacterium]